MKELIEDGSIFRWSMFPIRDTTSWEKFYLKAQEQFWVHTEIDKELAKDKTQWDKLSPEIQKFILYVLAFFAVSDGKVGEIIEEEIMPRIKMREAMLWYNFKNMMEDIHNIVYAKLVETYVPDRVEQAKLLNSVDHYPVIKSKIGWINKWMGSQDNDLWELSVESRRAIQILLSEHAVLREAITKSGSIPQNNPEVVNLQRKLGQSKPPLARVIFLEAILEGIFFSGSFCAIFWIYHQYGKLPGLTKANEFISRDEGMHTAYDIYLYNNHIQNRLPQRDAHEMISEAVSIESDFICEALPAGLPGMNADLMTQYIQFVADQLLVQMRYARIYNVGNPFDFMEKQSIGVRMSDFFVDGNVSEYGHFAAGTTAEDQQLDFGEDF
jgi:ribonucleotide reductase beta subunit family protein with ferritin-like domain